MMKLDVYKSFDPHGSGVGEAPFSRLLLPGPVRRVESVQVDVQVRRYDEAVSLAHPLPITQSKTGEFPVGTLLDCYV